MSDRILLPVIIPGEVFTLDQFADLCEASGMTPVAGSGRWAAHPDYTGPNDPRRWVIEVRVEKKDGAA
jgi:hypothetical protein